MPPVGRMPISRICSPMADAFRTCVTKRLRSSASPIAEPPPAPPQIGATNEPTFSP